MGLGATRATAGGGGGPTSLYDTDDFTDQVNNSHREIIDADSFRAARNGSGNGIHVLPVANGTYRLTGTMVAYDGAETGITGTRCRIQDNTTTEVTLTATGAFDETMTITNGSIRFILPSLGYAYRIDDFFVEAA